MITLISRYDMKQYLALMQNVLNNGESDDQERTGVGTICTFGEHIKFDLRKGFPAVTTKKLAWKGVISELLWMIRGSSNLYELRAILHGEEHRFNNDKKTIWDANYYKQAIALGYTDGEMGSIYGSQWRNFNGVDQLKNMIELAKVDPSNRRLIVSAWNPAELDKMSLPPCHYLFQINVKGNYVDLSFNMRSLDVFLGCPFDIASYATLSHIIARILDKTPRYLSCHFGNTHIYKNHIEQAKMQLERIPFDLPTLLIDPSLQTLEDFELAHIDQFKLENYRHHDPIKADMAV